MLRTDFHFELPDLIAQRPTDGAPIAACWSSRPPAVAARPSIRTFRRCSMPRICWYSTIRGSFRRGCLVKSKAAAEWKFCSSACSRRPLRWSMRAPARDLKTGATVNCRAGESARMLARDGELFACEFSTDVLAFFEAHGEMPLPPYIDRRRTGRSRALSDAVRARIGRDCGADRRAAL